MRRRLSPTACVARTSMPAWANCPATKAVFVSVSCPSSSSVPTATSSTLGIALLEPLGIAEAHIRAESARRIDHRFAPQRRAGWAGVRGAHGLALAREHLDEPGEFLVHRSLERNFERLP